MAYYGSLVPNTAIAKEAGMADWARGWAYLMDFMDPYGLVLPVAVLCIPLGFRPWSSWMGRGEWGRIALVIAPVVAGLLSVTYVVRLGGDFMHARMLLPAFFAMTLPAFAWVPTRSLGRTALARASSVMALSLLGLWAIYSATTLRVSYAGGLSPTTAIADERGFYASATGEEHPVTVVDYYRAEFGARGEVLRRRAAMGEDVLILEDGSEHTLPPGSGVVAVYGHIGVTGVAAGTDVHLVDVLGLADPLAARMELARRVRAGHEKSLPVPWIFARSGIDAGGPQVADARTALGCQRLRELGRATTDPITMGLLAKNLVRSFSLTRLRIPTDPSVARQQLCP